MIVTRHLVGGGIARYVFGDGLPPGTASHVADMLKLNDELANGQHKSSHLRPYQSDDFNRQLEPWGYRYVDGRVEEIPVPKPRADHLIDAALHKQFG